MSTVNVPPVATGLRGQTVGSTEIATVGKEGVGLTYRGYPIEELAAQASFEEVAYLLIRGRSTDPVGAGFISPQTQTETPTSGAAAESTRIDPGGRTPDGCAAVRLFVPRST